MTRCDDCGRTISCPLRGTPGTVGCKLFVSHDILQRTLRDTPPNEWRLRGQHESPARMVELRMTGRRCD